jgi:hypothetical protein
MTSALKLSSAGCVSFRNADDLAEEGWTYRNDLLISMLQLLNSISAGAPNSTVPSKSHDQLSAQIRSQDKD